MFVADLVSSGALGPLELGMRFAAQRQRLIAHNIANIDTPGYQMLDAPPQEFQAMLADAIDRRRAGGPSSSFEWDPTEGVGKSARGELELEPIPSGGGVMFHDRNDRDVERLLQDQVENLGYFRAMTDLLRSRHQHLVNALAERIA